MFFVILAFLLLVPIVEIYVIVQVAGAIGGVEALLLLVAISVAGAWLVKREGLSLLRRIQDQLNRGQLPADEMVDGLLLLVAGCLMVVPGFISDIIGLLLLIPFVRMPLRALVFRRFRHRLQAYSFVAPGSGARFGAVDVDVVRESTRRPSTAGDPPELGTS